MTARLIVYLIKKSLPIMAALVIVALLYRGYGAWDYTVKNLPEFFRLVMEHLVLVVISMTLAIGVGVILGTLMTRKGFEKGASTIMAMVNVTKISNSQWTLNRRMRGAARSEPKAPVTSAQEISAPMTVAWRPISFK